MERLRRRRVYTAARRDLDATQRKRSPPRDRSEGGTIGRIEVNGNGGNGVSYVRLVENRWPSIFTPPPLVSIRRDRRGWPCFSGLKGERFSGRKKEEERGNEREKKERERGRERKEKREEKKIRRKEKRRRTVDDEQVGRD